MVEDSLAAELEGDLSRLAVGLLGHGSEDGTLGDVGVHLELVLEAGDEDHVVDVDGSNLSSEKVVVEGDVALGYTC